MNLKLIALFFLVLPMLATAQKIKEPDVADCLGLNGYSYIDFTPFPGTPTTRTLEYAGKTITLTVKEGYRIRYAWQGIKFLDVKIEYPAAENFVEELAALMEYYDHLASSSEMKVTLPEDSLGYAAFFADRRDLSPNYLVLAMDLLVDVPNKRFIYLYYWNPNKERQILADMEGFIAEKKKSLKAIIECLQRN